MLLEKVDKLETIISENVIPVSESNKVLSEEGVCYGKTVNVEESSDTVSLGGSNAPAEYTCQSNTLPVEYLSPAGKIWQEALQSWTPVHKPV